MNRRSFFIAIAGATGIPWVDKLLKWWNAGWGKPSKAEMDQVAESIQALMDKLAHDPYRTDWPKHSAWWDEHYRLVDHQARPYPCDIAAAESGK